MQHRRPANQPRHQFQHTPLPGERYLRLLRILPDDTKSLSLTLHTFPLGNLPKYAALSYTWGKAIQAEGQEEDNDHGALHEISLDSRSHTITENLYDGLLELREDLDGFLWVDAVCIDQENIDERASQVLLMGDIYSSAQRVIIWLGKEIDEIVGVIWLLDNYLPVAGEGQFPLEEANSELLEFLGIDLDRWFELWKQHGRLYSLYRWFSRAWIVQELILARDIVMRCGGRTIDWANLKKLYQLALRSGVPSSDHCRTFFTLANLQNKVIDCRLASRILDLLTRATGTTTTAGRWYTWLIHLVNSIRPQKAGRSHDKLYAVFGLAHKSIPAGLEFPNSLMVDYEQPVELLFVQFVHHLLVQMPKPAILSDAVAQDRLAPSKLKDLPSWCPDFTASRSGGLLISVNFHLRDQNHAFEAGGSLENRNKSPRVSGSVLSIAARRVAKVASLGQATRPVFDFNEAPLSPPNSEGLFASCFLLDPIYGLTGQDRVEVLWRTLLADCDAIHATEQGGPPASETFAPAFSAFITVQALVVLGELESDEKEDFVRLIGARELIFESSIVKLPTLLEILTLEEQYMANLQGLISSDLMVPQSLYRARAAQYCVGRRLFTTAQKWLGLGPETLKLDDEVWLLRNADVPFILRPNGEGQYTLVGEAYVHGIMHGELVNFPGGHDEFQYIDIV